MLIPSIHMYWSSNIDLILLADIQCRMFLWASLCSGNYHHKVKEYVSSVLSCPLTPPFCLFNAPIRRKATKFESHEGSDTNYQKVRNSELIQWFYLTLVAQKQIWGGGNRRASLIKDSVMLNFSFLHSLIFTDFKTHACLCVCACVYACVCACVCACMCVHLYFWGVCVWRNTS